MASKGMFSRASAVKPRNDLKGHIGLTAYDLIAPGAEGSLRLKVILDEIEPGGGIEPHYHNIPAAHDHSYYVISGEILATIGERTEKVGPDTLLYFPTDVVHAIKNVGKTTAKVLLIGTAEPGSGGGNSVFLK